MIDKNKYSSFKMYQNPLNFLSNESLLGISLKLLFVTCTLVLYSPLGIP